MVIQKGINKVIKHIYINRDPNVYLILEKFSYHSKALTLLSHEKYLFYTLLLMMG